MASGIGCFVEFLYYVFVKKEFCGFLHIKKCSVHKSLFSVFMSERVLERKSCGRFKSTKDRKKSAGNFNCG